MQIQPIQNIYAYKRFWEKSSEYTKAIKTQNVILNNFSVSYYPITFGSKLNDNYDEWFKAYLKCTNEKESIATEINKILTDSEYAKTLQNKKEIKILDIGCGNGLLTEKVLCNVIKLFPKQKLIVDALDVNEKLLDEYNVRCDKFQNKICLKSHKKDFFTSDLINNQYDLIIASHVLYYSDNLDKAIKKIYENLSPNGKAIIVHHSGEYCVLSELRAKYNPTSSANLEQTKEDITKIDIIKNSLEKQDIPHEILKQYFKLTIFQNNNKDFRNLISFIIDKPYNTLLKENKVVDLFKDIKDLTNEKYEINLFNKIYVITKGNKHDADF